MHSSDTAEIVMEDMRLPEDALLGEEGKGFYQIMWELQGERLVAAAGAVAGSQLLFDRCLQYVKERQAFGQPIGKFQTMGHRLAEMATEIHAARELVYDAVWKFNKGEYPVKEISMAKLYTGLVCNRISNHAMQIFGGAAYLMDLPIQRAWRDTRLMRIGGGADEVMREILAKMKGL
jgi:alkylation response protein AidB-like acyl-CoA dehydrogenase